MLFAKEKITVINNLIKSYLTDNRFAGSLYANTPARLVSQETRDSEKSIGPCTIEGAEFNHIGFDDVYPLIAYHRILDTSYTYSNDAVKRVAERNLMRLVVYGKGLGITTEQLTAVIAANFPHEIPSSLYSGFKNFVVNLSRSDQEPQSVYRTEYPNTPFSLGPEDILLAITYTIDSAYQLGCYNICDCINTNT